MIKNKKCFWRTEKRHKDYEKQNFVFQKIILCLIFQLYFVMSAFQYKQVYGSHDGGRLSW